MLIVKMMMMCEVTTETSPRAISLTDKAKMLGSRVRENVTIPIETCLGNTPQIQKEESLKANFKQMGKAQKR